MKVFLLHRDRDFEVDSELRDEIFGAMRSGNLHAIANAKRELDRRLRMTSPPKGPGKYDGLEQDLELETLWGAMASGDEFLYETAKRVVLTGMSDPDEIRYRQQVLADCLTHAGVVRQLYKIAIEALASERDAGALWRGAMPDWILRRSVRLLDAYVDCLRQLRGIADEHGEGFRSEGFGRFFAMMSEELTDDYLETVERHLGELELKRGVLESAELGAGDKGARYAFHQPPQEPGWRQRLLPGKQPPSYSFDLHPRDEAGFRALTEIKGRGLNPVADAVAQSADHVQSFFVMLRLELAFYLGCLNLHRRLQAKGEPTCFPDPVPESELALTARGIYDVCLTFHNREKVVGNDLDADGKSLLVITGANQGGKSTLLRGLGVAQLMMQSGMFVGGQSFRAGTRAGVFTHYKREEDAAMEGGKLDEELSRMSAIVDQIQPHSLLLCNESFASTNEREGSEIARQVVRALLAKRVRVLFVTHMYELAGSLHVEQLDTALFLRAQREPDGRRTFKLREAEPLPTSYGEDSYRRIFGDARSSLSAVIDSRP
jgi:MutS domain V